MGARPPILEHMRRPLAGLVLAAITVTAACTVDRPSASPTMESPIASTPTDEPPTNEPTVPSLDLDPHANQPPEPFAARLSTPTGWRTIHCPDLRRHGSGLTVVAAVPRAVTGIGQTDGLCSMSTHRLARGFTLELGPRSSLAERARRDVVPFLGQQGDDGITSASYDGQARVFGTSHGEALEVHPYNDGLPTDYRLWQSRGVVAGASVPEGTWDRYADGVHTFVGTVSVIRGLHASCPGDVAEVRYRPPARLTSYVQTAVAAAEGRAASTCWISLRGGTSVIRHAEIRLDPRGSLARRADRLRARRTVRSLRWQPAATRIDGLVADRLTWVVSRGERDYEAGGTWRLVTVSSRRIQVTWGATPEQWRRERPVFARLLRSLRLVPTTRR